jgi:hypothetical protein
LDGIIYNRFIDKSIFKFKQKQAELKASVEGFSTIDSDQNYIAAI